MQSPKLLIIGADATPDLGAGHVMRCLALAQAWKEAGGNVVFWGRVVIPWVRERICQEGFRLREGVDQLARLSHQKFGNDLTAVVGEYFLSSDYDVWVVLDGYDFTLEHHRQARSHGRRLLVVDDNNHLPEYEADILFNSNPLADQFRYYGAVGRKCLGHRYALIRREFRDVGGKVADRQQKNRVGTILITLGGGDISPFLQEAIGWLEQVDLSNVSLRVVANEIGEEALKKIGDRLSGRLEILDHVNNMAELLQDTDFCITAAGATCWELCYLGIPFVAFSIADNQKDNFRFLEDNGIVFPQNPSALQQALDDTSEFSLYVRRMLALIDGRGAVRLCRAMGVLGPANLSMRRAKSEDVHFVFELVNDPLVRSTAFHPEPIPFKAHCDWFTRFLDSEALFFIAEKGGQPCGYVRFEQGEGALMVTIAVDPHVRGEGVGLYLLAEGCARAARITPAQPFRAYVKVDNEPSLHLFQSAGFEKLQQKDHLGAKVWMFERREGGM